MVNVSGSASLPSELYFTVEPSDTIAVRDGSVLLNCSAKGSSTPVYEWKRDENRVQFIGDVRRKKERRIQQQKTETEFINPTFFLPPCKLDEKRLVQSRPV
ncbi:hypothetical protein TNCV_1735391 [Trichonephila clavipes]|nr:hypothetical protein TNCV_1735391 [Trichonephila clavipes]